MWEVLLRSDLLRMGWNARQITAAVRAGSLVRARQGRYFDADVPPRVVEAVRIGGRVGCMSLLALLGVFVFDSSTLHVHMTRGASRMRTVATRRRMLPKRALRAEVTLHWHPLVETPTSSAVHLVDALIHAVRCQSPRHAIATLDSAINTGLIGIEQLAAVFAILPARFAALLPLIDGRAESGPETLVRLMARSLGFEFDLQVHVTGVGDVDLLLDGWLVVECDSRAHHSSWQQQLKDYRRDLRLAQLGYSVVRFTAQDILYSPESVLAALRGLRTARR